MRDWLMKGVWFGLGAYAVYLLATDPAKVLLPAGLALGVLWLARRAERLSATGSSPK